MDSVDALELGDGEADVLVDSLGWPGSVGVGTGGSVSTGGGDDEDGVAIGGAVGAAGTPPVTWAGREATAEGARDDGTGRAG